IKLYEECIDDFLDENSPIKYDKEIFKFTELYRNSIWLTKNIKESTSIRRNISKVKNLIQLKGIFESIIQSFNS
ncbi:MAG: hypothetical protein KGD74_11810, partial [Candidatus Lokiarchaeota archaeon]|nr:hypothetical protein [Candidatus Lokiarchaeota archaeon]